jgi:YtcA family
MKRPICFMERNPEMKKESSYSGHSQTPAGLHGVAISRSLRLAGVGLCLGPLLLAAGCSRAPSFNILGSFFPSWILCGVLGILLTVVVRVVFVRLDFEKELTPLIVFYPCMALFFTFSIWLVFFS